MHKRMILLAGAVLGVAWLVMSAGGESAHAGRADALGTGARSGPNFARDPHAESLAARRGLASPDSIFGNTASPFGRLDCNANHRTTACNPDDSEADPSVKAPLMTLIRNLSDEISRGKFEAVGELTSNLRECAARAAAPPMPKDQPMITGLPEFDEHLSRETWACDTAEVAKRADDARTRLEQAALGGSAPAQVAYGEFLKSDLMDAIAAMYREKVKGMDLTASKAKFAASKATVVAYAKSGRLAPQDAKQLLDIVEPLEAEP